MLPTAGPMIRGMVGPSPRHVRTMALMRGPVELISIVGVPTFNRGSNYAQSGRTMILDSEDIEPARRSSGGRIDRTIRWVEGISRGSYGVEYHVEVDYELSRTGTVKLMSGNCDCPVGIDCKHAVSLLILDWEAQRAAANTAAATSSNNTSPQWQETLGDIFGDLDDYLRIGLAVEFNEPRAAAPQTTPSRNRFASGLRDLGSTGTVNVRPVSPGKRTPWITTEVTWRKLQSSGVYEADPRQANALLDLYNLYSANAYYGADAQWVRLTEINNAALWPTLQEIAASGVELVENKTWQPVVLEPEPARADVTIREDSTGIDLLGSVGDDDGAPNSDSVGAARSGLTIKAELFHPHVDAEAKVVRVGRPFHGVAWRRDGVIRLARLEAPAAAHWLKLSSQVDGVRVPAEGRARFEEELLPLISRVGWTSPGESYVPPPAKDATLHLAVALSIGTKAGVAPRALLHWSWGRDTAALEVLRSGGSMLPAKMPALSAVGQEFSQLQPILQAMENESERARKEQVRQKKRRQLIPDPRETRRNFVEEAMQLAQVGEIVGMIPATLDESPAASWAARDLTLTKGIVTVRFPRQDCELHGIDVVHFVDDVVPRLAELGVTVEEIGEIPQFHAAPTPSVQVDVGLGEGGTRDWLDLNITMKVGDHEIPMPVLLTALTKGDEALFLPSGEYVRLDIPELARLRELLAEARLLNDRKRSGIRVPRVRTSWWEELLTLDVVESASNAWFDAIKRAVTDPPKPAPIPSGLIAQLRPYQKSGFEWLAGLRRSGLGAVLADDMGLGKTVQTLAMIQDEREQSAVARAAARRTEVSARSGLRSGSDEGKFASPDDAEPTASGGASLMASSGSARSRGADVTGQGIDRATSQVAGPWLVVAPTSVVANWAAEARKFTPGLRVATVDATRKRRGAELAALAHDVDILITSYTLLRLEYEDYAALRPVGMVLDEAQQAKNPASKTFSSLIKVGAPVVYAITGTPMENNLSELWAMFALVAPGLLGNAKQFRENVQKPVEKGVSDAGQVLALLRRRIAPFLLRRTKRAVASELPEKQEQIIEIELAPAHRRLYDRQLQRERQRVLHLADDLDHNRVEVLSALTRLRQLSIDPALVDEEASAPSSKLETLLPLLAEASEEGHRTLVFSQFTRYLRSIAARLEAEGIAYAYLDGSTTNRRAVIEGFAEGDAPVFLISLKAGGVGLNLTMADYVVITDPWWNPAVEEQAVDRTHRIGQTRAVHVYRLVSQNTIEEKVLALQDSKRQLIAGVLASDDVAGAGAGAGGESTGGSGVSTGAVGVSGAESLAAPVVGGAKLSAEDLRMLLS